MGWAGGGGKGGAPEMWGDMLGKLAPQEPPRKRAALAGQESRQADGQGGGREQGKVGKMETQLAGSGQRLEKLGWKGKANRRVVICWGAHIGSTSSLTGTEEPNLAWCLSQRDTAPLSLAAGDR